jgi:hypothetical protein
MAGKAEPATGRLQPQTAATLRANGKTEIDQPVDAIATLREVGRQMELLSQMLLWPSPEVLDNCDRILAAVTRHLEASRPGWRKLAGNSDFAKEARRTSKAVQKVRRLLDGAAEFYNQWHRIRAAMTGYRADGAPERIPCRGRIVAEG